MTENKKGSRAWCFTINNYTITDFEQVEAMFQDAVYGIVGQEVGESGTPHYQGYVYFQNAKTLKRMSKYLTRAHIQVSYGSPEQNKLYCSKQDNVLLEHGELPKQGKRNDLDDIKEVIRNGGTMRQVVDIATSYQAAKMAELILKYKEPKRNWKPKVEWFFGPTGSGKTRKAFEILGEDAYVAMSTGRWWDGYDGEHNVIIDDMRKDFCKFHELLRYLDRYAMRVETKGGSRQFLAKHIIITSAFSPTQLFDTREDLQQLLRRIDNIEYIDSASITWSSSDNDLSGSLSPVCLSEGDSPRFPDDDYN